MLNISKQLFSAWNDAGLLYCHWKSNEHLLPGLDGLTDLDVLLSRDDKTEGEYLLNELDFLQCRSQFGSRYPNVDDWIGFDKETGNLIHVHLHYGIVTGHKGMKEYALQWTDMALKTRILNEEYGVYTMEPNLEMVTLYTRIGLKADFKSLARCMKGTFKFPKDVQREIDWLKEHVDMNRVHHLLETFYGEKAESVYRIMEKEKIKSSDYLALRKITESVFKKCRRIKCFVRLREILFYIYQKWGKWGIGKFDKSIITKKVPKSGVGTTIAFIGQDGCGKSTVTTEIQKWLNWKIEAKRFYLGSGEHYNSLYKRLLSKGSKLKKRRGKTQIDSTKDVGQPSKIVKRKKNIKNFIIAYLVAKKYLTVARRAYKEVLTSEKYRRKGGTPLFDRFPQSQFEGIYDGPKIASYIRGTGLDFFVIRQMAKRERRYIERIQQYQPKVVFKLMLSPDESIRRKPFERLETVARKHEITKKLQFNDSIVHVVDAAQDYQQELVFIKNMIWKVLVQKQ